MVGVNEAIWTDIFMLNTFTLPTGNTGRFASIKQVESQSPTPTAWPHTMQQGNPRLLAVTTLALEIPQTCLATPVHQIETVSSSSISTMVTTDALSHLPKRSDFLYREQPVASMAPIDTTRANIGELAVLRKRKGGRGGGGGRGSGSSAGSGGTGGATQVGVASPPGVSRSAASSRHGGNVVVIIILSSLASLVMLDLFA
ncbi:hypothetical protein KVT40_008916 [Elsinoe batatas]|uniref:Uncharacterized protein n=1 Tax=Elsinoe batatas TaxID=2601811 RepID=A0A8K0P9X5_9PEZI|nr:hypothetical protein KVT40_008916 [Elsinoe batatas]